MIIGHIDKATRILRGPPDMPDCQPLAIRDMILDGSPAMVSVWEPTPAEVKLLLGGAKLYLYVYGTAHPPVALSIGNEP